MHQSLNQNKLSLTSILLFACVLVFIIFSTWGGLEHVYTLWLEREEYSHGFFIPIISLMLLWHRRQAIVESIGQPSWYGFGLLLFTALLLVVGELTAIYILIQFSFILMLIGMILLFGGISLLRVVLLPVAFLIFAIPMPYFIDAQLTWGLQLISSKLGTDFLRLLGISVYLEGNVIDLGVYKLQVVEACSGLNYLYPLLSLGFLAAYLFSAPLWQRVIIFLSTIPITIFMNSFRIAVIGVLVERWGTDMAEGFLHFFEGWVIFIGCAVLLLIEIWLFDRLGKKRAVGDLLVLPEIKPVSPQNYKSDGLLGASNIALFIALLFICTLSAATMFLDERQEILPEKKSLEQFPLVLQDWSARQDYLPSIVENKLNVDDYYLGDYRDKSNNLMNFYIAYYASQRKGSSPHSPRVCIPGGGWQIADFSEIIINEPGYEPFPVNRIVIEYQGDHQVGYYWFEQRGRRIANEYWMKWYLLKDSLFMNRTDGALVRVLTTVKKDENLELAEKRVRGFVNSVLPILPEYVPGK